MRVQKGAKTVGVQNRKNRRFEGVQNRLIYRKQICTFAPFVPLRGSGVTGKAARKAAALPDRHLWAIL